MEKKHCKECKLEVNDIEPVRCGFCDAFFHISQQCCGFNHRANRDILSQGKAMFICNDCRSELNGRSIKRYLQDQLDSQNSTHADGDASDNLTSQVQLLADAVGKLSKKVDVLSMGQMSGSKTNLLLTPTFRKWPKLGVKRPRMETEQYESTALNSDRGTRNIDLGDLSIDTIIPVPTPPKFWLYLSGFQPLISTDDVQKIVTRCMDLSSPCDVVRLVPKGKDVSNMSFVSFKIGFDPSVKEQALQASTWLNGLTFREFVEQPKNYRRTVANPMDINQTPV